MATLVVTNLTSSPVWVNDLYATVAASSSISTTRMASEIPAMKSLHELVQAGTVSVSVTYSAAEKASGLVDQGDTAPTASGLSDEQVIRVPLVAGVAGTADDVTVFALNALPYKKMRILEAYALISTAIVATTLQVRTQSGGAGTLCAEVPGTPTGRIAQNNTVTASQVITNGASVGLFVRRSDRGVAGELIIRVRPET